MAALDVVDANDAGTVHSAETAVTNAEADLATAEGNLATLQAATAAAQATVSALEMRILRADAQLDNLGELVKGAPEQGTLDIAAALRVKAYNDFNNDGSGDDPKGEAVLAAEAKAAADDAVKLRSSGAITEAGFVDETRGDGGNLLEDRALALAAWNLKKQESTAAESALSTALGDADLTALRAAVEQKTQDWNQQNGVL